MPESVVDPNLAAIKQREQNVKDAIRRGEPSIDLEAMRGMQFTQQQLGLRDVIADEWGRLWRTDRTRLTLIFSPSWFRLGGDVQRDEYDGK